MCEAIVARAAGDYKRMRATGVVCMKLKSVRGKKRAVRVTGVQNRYWHHRGSELALAIDDNTFPHKVVLVRGKRGSRRG